MLRTACLTCLLLPALPVLAENADGTLNPPELGIARVLDNAANGKVDMMTCASGYYMTKKGDHSDARAVFEACADAGYTAAMTWMGQLDNNGLGAEYNPDAAADWDRRAADAGDPVGQFNFGLDLIRGHGVAQDTARGRALVDAAAQGGLQVARRLQAADYDPEEVTPDADSWKYGPNF